MGITGLLPFLKKSSRPTHVKEFKGQTVAIDSYCWLHKGAFGCAEKLARGEETDQYVGYCLTMVNMLIGNGIKPIMVFDGRNLPSKKETELKRRANRDDNRKKAAQALRDGNPSLARTYFERCVDVTSQMALQLMKACRAIGVDCIIAPYEADSQLAYLSMKGIAQIVISEDSDLVPFGCERVFFKMDKVGNGVLIDRKDLGETLPSGFTHERFRWMCILSGCDYLASLPGIGLAKALKLFQRCTSSDVQSTLRKIPIVLNMNKVKVSDDYIESFVRADRTFLYQLVFDPLLRKLVPLTPIPEEIANEDLIYAGLLMKDEEAFQLALGNLDCNNMKVIYDYDPENHDLASSFSQSTNVSKKGKSSALQPLSRSSIWHKDFQIGLDFRRVWDEESRTNQSRRQAEANVPSLLTDNAKARKLANEGNSKNNNKTDSKSGFFSAGGKDTGKPSTRNNLFKTSHSQPQNGRTDVIDRLKMKSRGSWSGKIEREEEEEKLEDDILVDYGGTNAEKSGLPVENAKERMALFAKVPAKRKMSWNAVGRGDDEETQTEDNDYENGNLFKRAKFETEESHIDMKQEENEHEDVEEQPVPDASSQPISAAPTSPPTSHSISPISLASPPPTPSPPTPPPSSSPPPANAPILTTPTMAKPTLLFRKVSFNRRETWHQLSATSPKSEVEVRSRYFHAPPAAIGGLTGATSDAVSASDADVNVRESENNREKANISTGQNTSSPSVSNPATSSPASSALRTPKRNSLFGWNSSSSSPLVSPRESSSAGPDSRPNSPACSKPFQVVAKKETQFETPVDEKGSLNDDEEEIGRDSKDEVIETSTSLSSLSSSQKENAETIRAKTETATKNVSARLAFNNSPKVMTRFSNPVKSGKSASLKKDDKKATPSIMSFFSKK